MDFNDDLDPDDAADLADVGRATLRELAPGAYTGPVDPQTCEHAGHEWASMGGGMLVCLRCEAEKWED